MLKCVAYVDVVGSFLGRPRQHTCRSATVNCDALQQLCWRRSRVSHSAGENGDHVIVAHFVALHILFLLWCQMQNRFPRLSVLIVVFRWVTLLFCLICVRKWRRPLCNSQFSSRNERCYYAVYWSFQLDGTTSGKILHMVNIRQHG